MTNWKIRSFKLYYNGLQEYITDTVKWGGGEEENSAENASTPLQLFISLVQCSNWIGSQIKGTIWN